MRRRGYLDKSAKPQKIDPAALDGKESSDSSVDALFSQFGSLEEFLNFFYKLPTEKQQQFKPAMDYLLKQGLLSSPAAGDYKSVPGPITPGKTPSVWDQDHSEAVNNIYAKAGGGAAGQAAVEKYFDSLDPTWRDM